MAKCRNENFMSHTNICLIQRVLGVVHVQIAIVHLGESLSFFYLNTKGLQRIDAIVVMGNTRPECCSDGRIALLLCGVEWQFA